MAVKGKSARGEIVDFDLLEIKKQIASAPPSSEVTRRKDFIENKMRRRVKKTPNSISPVDVDSKTPIVAEPVQEDIIIKKSDREIQNNTETKPKNTTETKPSIKKTTKQKARTTKKEPDENNTSTEK